MLNIRSLFLSSVMTSLMFALSSLSSAAPLDEAVKLTGQSHEQSAQSQKQLDAISEHTQATVNDLLHSERQADITEAYNAQLFRLIQSQHTEIEDLHRQIDSIEETEQAMLPLLNVMLAELQSFVEQDLPFLQEERQKRLTRLAALVDRADVSVAEKYRQILEAYLVEVGYGRTIEAYSGVQVRGNLSGSKVAADAHVNYLRMGRMALYYQSLNGQESGLWLPSKKAWQALDSDQNLIVTKAIQIAQQQRVPELMSLPVPLPLSVSSNGQPNLAK